MAAILYLARVMIDARYFKRTKLLIGNPMRIGIEIRVGLASIVIGEMALHPLFWIEDYNGRSYFLSLKN